MLWRRESAKLKYSRGMLNPRQTELKNMQFSKLWTQRARSLFMLQQNKLNRWKKNRNITKQLG